MGSPDEDDRRRRYLALVDEVGEPLARYLGRRAAPDEAHDVWADALLVLWRRLDDVPTDAALAWSYGVARRCLANSRRSRARHLALVRRLGAQRHADADLDGQYSNAAADDTALLAAMALLSVADRELLRLSAWEDLGASEIALVLGLTPNAVSIRLHRARGRLRAALDNQAGGERTHGTRAHGDQSRKKATTSEHKSDGHRGRETA